MAVFMELDWVLNNVFKVKKDRVVEIFESFWLAGNLWWKTWKPCEQPCSFTAPAIQNFPIA